LDANPFETISNEFPKNVHNFFFKQFQMFGLCNRLKFVKHLSRPCQRYYSSYFNNKESVDLEVEREEQEFTQLRVQAGLSELPERPENVLIVHPRIRWGPNATPGEDIQAKLDEATALVRTLPGFTVARFVLRDCKATGFLVL
jgi:hypothetical protein